MADNYQLKKEIQRKLSDNFNYLLLKFIISRINQE